MERKIFFTIFASFLVMLFISLSFVFAETKTGEYQGSFDVDVGDARIDFNGTIPTPRCQEDWTCSYWSECTNNNKVFNCRDCNHCGTYSLLPQNCGATEACQQSNNGNNNGGNNNGRSSSGDGTTTYSSSKCTEKWNCSEWGECLAGKQTRTCTDQRNCGTSDLKPATSQECSEKLNERLNLSEIISDKKGFFSRLTGAVTGAFGTAGSIGAIIFITAIIILAILVGVMRKREVGKK